MLAPKYLLVIATLLILATPITFLVVTKVNVEPEVVKIYKTVTPIERQTTPLDTPATPDTMPTNQQTDAEALHRDDTETQEVDDNINTEPVDFSDAFNESQELLDEETDQSDVVDIPVSPFGFGAYPKIPSDYPFTPIWAVSDEVHQSSQDNYGSTGMRNLELLSRVMIKLWSQGHRDLIGGSIDDNGNVYPVYRNTAYVTY
jgi:hypothetical protein